MAQTGFSAPIFLSRLRSSPAVIWYREQLVFGREKQKVGGAAKIKIK